MTINSAINQAVGKWDNIYQSLNIDVFPKNKHRPCPVCGGRDRFRYDDKNSKGDFICNQCGSGDGINLIERLYSCNTKEAISMVADCLNLNVSQNHNNTTEITAVHNIQDNPVCKKVEYLLSQSKLGQSDYLTRKGITFNLSLLDGGKIIAPMINVKGEYTGAQFITADGNKQLMRGTNKKGSFIAINQDGEISPQLAQSKEIIICEGLATGLTLREFNQDKLIIISLDAGNIIHVAEAIREINQQVKIIIGADNDTESTINTGLNKATQALESVGGWLAIPDTDYNCDWNDYASKYGLDKTSKAFTQVMREIAREAQPVSQKAKNKETKPTRKKDNRIQNNTSANKRADLLIEEYGNNLAYHRKLEKAYLFTGKHWEQITMFDLSDKLIEIYEVNNIDYNITNIEKVIKLTFLKLPQMAQHKDKAIYFDNGAYCIESMTFKPHNKFNYNTSSNGITYKPMEVNQPLEIGAPVFYKYLSNAVEQDPVKLLGALSLLYIILTNRHDWHYFIELTGLGGTGKSTFSELARLLVGDNNAIDSDINDLEKKSSTRTALIDKTLLILSDQAQYQGEGDLLKKISGGDWIAVDPKYKDSTEFKSQMIVLAVNNSPMVFNGYDSGMDRRHIRLVFNNIVKAPDRDHKLLDKIKIELPFIINYLLREFADDKKTIATLEALRVSDEAEEIKRSSNPIYDFMRYLTVLDTADGLFIGIKTVNTNMIKPTEFLYHGYDAFYSANYGKSPQLSVKSLMKQIKTILQTNGSDYKTRAVNGRTRTNLNYSCDIQKEDWIKDATPVTRK